MSLLRVWNVEMSPFRLLQSPAPPRFPYDIHPFSWRPRDNSKPLLRYPLEARFSIEPVGLFKEGETILSVAISAAVKSFRSAVFIKVLVCSAVAPEMGL